MAARAKAWRWMSRRLARPWPSSKPSIPGILLADDEDRCAGDRRGGSTLNPIDRPPTVTQQHAVSA